jgi:hypothetical protein
MRLDYGQYADSRGLTPLDWANPHLGVLDSLAAPAYERSTISLVARFKRLAVILWPGCGP